MHELYKKHRPKKFSDVIGQDLAVKTLQRMLEADKLPHAMLFSGPKGCGKTTLGRIIAKKIGCARWDFKEENCAKNRGIDFIRNIEERAFHKPMQGKTKVWLLDECHMLTSEASNAFLKILEDTPSHVYFILCTTDPHKLIPTIRSRCTPFPIKPLNATHIKDIVNKVCKKEKVKLSTKVIDKIAESADDSARNALVFLDKVILLDDEEEQLDAISKATAEAAAIEIARALFRRGTTWKQMSQILKDNSEEEPESMRYMILGYAKSIMLSGGPLSGKAFEVIQVFRDNWYDCKAAGLVACCYEIITAK